MMPYDKQGNKHSVFATIISDPDEQGGFLPGAKFTWWETNQMLVMKHFNPGTVLQVNRTNEAAKARGFGSRGKFKIIMDGDKQMPLRVTAPGSMHERQ